MKKNSLLLFIMVGLFFDADAQVRYDTVSSLPVGPGMIHTQYLVPGIPRRVSLLQVDLKNPYTKIESMKSNDRINGGLERVSAMAKRNNSPGHYVVGAVNGDFFDFATGNCIHMQIQNGEVLHRERSGSYPAIAVTANKGFAFSAPVFSGSVICKGVKNAINGVNETRGTNALVLFNSYFGASTGTDASGAEVTIRPVGEWFVNDTIPCVVEAVASGTGNSALSKGKAVLSGIGTAATFITTNIHAGDTLQLYTKVLTGPSKIKELVGGHPLIVKDGVVTSMDANSDFNKTQHPRTFVGINRDTSKMFLAVVDGRQPTISYGMSVWEMADFMIRICQAYHAVNLDGGGSSAMVVRGSVITNPSDPAGERSVANSLQIISLAPPGSLASLNIVEERVDVFQGRTHQFVAEGKDEFYNPISLPAGSTWSVDSSIGTIDSTGLFTAKNVNDSGWVKVRYQSVVDSAHVYVRVITRLSVYPQSLIMVPGERLTLTVRGKDSGGNQMFVQNEFVRFETNATGINVDASGVVTSTGFGGGTVTISLDTVKCILSYNSIGSDTSCIVETYGNRDIWTWDVLNTDPDNIAFSLVSDSVTSTPPALKITYSFPPPSPTVLLNTDIPLSSRVDSIYVDVYGDGGGHAFKLIVADKDGEEFSIVSLTNVTWKNEWKPVGFKMVRAVPVSAGSIDYPVTIKQIQILIGTVNLSGGKATGLICLDNIRAHYPNRTVSPTVLFDFNSGISGWYTPQMANVAQQVGIIIASSSLVQSTEHPYEGTACGKWTYVDDPANSADWNVRITRSTTGDLGSMLRGSYIGAWVWADGQTDITLRTVIRGGNGQICQGPPFPVNHIGWKLIGTRLDENLFSPYLTSGLITDANNKFNGFKVEAANARVNGQTRTFYIDKMVTSALTVPTGFIQSGAARDTTGGGITIGWSVNSEISINRYEIERSVAGGGYTQIGYVNAIGNIDTTRHYSFYDPVPQNNVSNSYRVRQITNDGAMELSPVSTIPPLTGANGEAMNPYTYALFQNYPNPFNPTTTISYTLARAGHVRIAVYDLLGREITLLVNEKQEAGQHVKYFDASTFSSGVYFYRLRSGDFLATKKMLVTK